MPEPTDQEKADPEGWEQQPWIVTTQGRELRIATATAPDLWVLSCGMDEALARHVVEVHNLWLEVQNTDVVGMTPKEKAVE